MRRRDERIRIAKILEAEIQRCRRKRESAQVYYACGSRSAKRTMDALEKYYVLERALEAYLDTYDRQQERVDRLLAVEEALERAEKQVYLRGDYTLPVRQLIEELRKTVRGIE